MTDLFSRQNQVRERALYVATELGFVGVIREILKVSDVQSVSLKDKIASMCSILLPSMAISWQKRPNKWKQAYQ